MTRLQKAITVIALALFFSVAIAGEIWEASHPPQAPQQSSAAYNPDSARQGAQPERPDEAIARYNFWLMIFTGFLAVGTIFIGAINGFQLWLARAEFIASHRPKIRVRRITPIGDHLLPDTAISLSVETTNIGDSTATIVQVGMDVYIADTPFHGVPRQYVLPRLMAGMEMRMTFATGRVLSEAEIDAIEVGTSEWRLLGIINYIDDNGVMRSTSLARVYNRAMRRFIPVTEYDPDADREYEN